MRKAAIPRREVPILKRLRESREFLGLTQDAFANQIDISRERLANYETQRTPLPCDLAFRICSQFILSERWLATGEGPMRRFMALSLSVSNPLLYRMPFGEAYDTSLAATAEKERELMEKEGAFFTVFKPAFWNSNRQFYKNFINALLDNWMDALEKKGKAEDFGDLARLLANSGQDHFIYLMDRILKYDPKTDEGYWVSASTGKRMKLGPLEKLQRP